MQSGESVQGIGGWLDLFLIGAILTVILAVAIAVGTHDLSDRSIAIAIGVIQIAGLILTLRRSPWTPDYWVIAIPVAAVLGLTLGPSDGRAPSAEPGSNLAFYIQIWWFVYWLRSQRVRETFGSNGRIRAWLNRVWLDAAKSTT